jgi:hypothetical protein
VLKSQDYFSLLPASEVQSSLASLLKVECARSLLFKEGIATGMRCILLEAVHVYPKAPLAGDAVVESLRCGSADRLNYFEPMM